MTEEEFQHLFLRSLHRGAPVMGVRALPLTLTRQIAAIALTSRFIGERGDIEFDVEVDGEDSLIRVEWTRGDGTRTINLVADGSWYAVYQSATVTSVVELLEDEQKQVDTTTMEAIMLMAGVHPTQL